MKCGQILGNAEKEEKGSFPENFQVRQNSMGKAAHRGEYNLVEV